MRSSRPVLLVEDDDVDVMTVERAFKELKIKNQLVHAANSEQALDYLRSDSNKKPCVIFLDLNMPGMDGIEFLKTIKADEALKMIPVVVLTTSGQEESKIDSFNLSVGGYMVKDVDYKKFTDIIRTIDQYWTLSELPEED